MATNLDRYKNDLETLIDRGEALHMALEVTWQPEKFEEIFKSEPELKKNLPDFADQYQAWYSESLALIKQLLPDRLNDFIRHYEKPKARKEIDFESYRIEDCLQGLRVTREGGNILIVDPSAALPHVSQQLSILKAVRARFTSSLFDIRQLVQADLFDSELEQARALAKSGFLRAAGAISGVVLEKHLGQVRLNHNLTFKKQHPAISDFNDLLKNEGVLDVPTWRFIQRLGDIRNLCDHNKQREPAKEEITELIDGVDKITKTIF